MLGSLWRRTRDNIGFVAAILTILGLGGIAAAYHWAEPSLRRFWNRVYPDVVVTLLAVACGGLALYVLRQRRQLQNVTSRLNDAASDRDEAQTRIQTLERRLQADETEWDRERIREIRRWFPRDAVLFFREHDFGSWWEWEHTRPVERFVHRGIEVEYRLHDEQLEDRRQALLTAGQDFIRALTKTFPHDGAGVLAQEVPPEWQFTPRHQEWEDLVEELNTTSTRVAEAYDALIDAARVRGLLDLTL
jgi:hypothetical protein